MSIGVAIGGKTSVYEIFTDSMEFLSFDDLSSHKLDNFVIRPPNSFEQLVRSWREVPSHARTMNSSSSLNFIGFTSGKAAQVNRDVKERGDYRLPFDPLRQEFRCFYSGNRRSNERQTTMVQTEVRLCVCSDLDILARF